MPLKEVEAAPRTVHRWRANRTKAGARGFLLKDAGPELLVQAIHAAANGDALISPDITRRLLTTLAGLPRRSSPDQPSEPLTDREEAVLLTVALGRTNTEIAEELHVSLRSEDSRGCADGQDRRPQPRGGRDVGVRDRARRGIGPGSPAVCGAHGGLIS